MKTKNENQLWINYYVVYELPFNILLVNKYAFSNRAEAENLISNRLKWFVIWGEEEYNDYKGRKIFIPFGGRKTDKNLYLLRIEGTVQVEAKDPTSAHRVIRKVLYDSLNLDSVKTELLSIYTLLKGK